MKKHQNGRIAVLQVMSVFIAACTIAVGTQSSPHAVTDGAVPFYPEAARVASVEGRAQVRLWTDGREVTRVDALLPFLQTQEALAKTLRTWLFTPHQPTSFETELTFKLHDRSCRGDENNTVVMRLPREVTIIGPARMLCGDPQPHIQIASAVIAGSVDCNCGADAFSAAVMMLTKSGDESWRRIPVDANGHFSAGNVDPGVYFLTLTIPGFLDGSFRVRVGPSLSRDPLKLALMKEPAPIPVVVSARYPEYLPELRSRGLHGEVLLRRTPNGEIQVLSGPASLVGPATRNLRTWVFRDRLPQEGVQTKYVYSLRTTDCERPEDIVTMEFPHTVQISFCRQE